ncbi:PilZ domain-containing protein [Bradyrhizobium sp.]|uniref:PilZ domain-containing protein n=1 Tax=Bradyrhizobium sp. TaxID=376 RepID=UPI002733220E|nr:PilZ domain-containing protein [Bradyrhizobium sp.]MDP3690221.1 PilZ domain-containing protein [Bradyrhizobium sp.]
MTMMLDRIVPCAADYDLWSYICSECSGVFSMVEPRTADRSSVDERRVVLRHAVTTPATISAGRRAFACTVHDLSATGASLTLTGRPRLPKHLTLMAAGSTLPCHAVWRRGKQLGIAFD